MPPCPLTPWLSKEFCIGPQFLCVLSRLYVKAGILKVGTILLFIYLFIYLYMYMKCVHACILMHDYRVHVSQDLCYGMPVAVRVQLQMLVLV